MQNDLSTGDVKMNDESKYTNEVAQTIEATSTMLSGTNPVLICFIITVAVLSASMYLQITINKQQIDQIVTELKSINQNLDKENLLLDRLIRHESNISVSD